MTPLRIPSIAATMNSATMPALRAKRTTTWVIGLTAVYHAGYAWRFTKADSLFILESLSGPRSRAPAAEVLNEQNHRHRSGHHQLRRRRDGRRRAGGDHQPGGRPPDAVGRRVPQDRRAALPPVGQGG